ncbi:MAG: PQQ-binding-like beta-propeller repeat protein [Planctomycetota bacterium]|nr:PQQ-binding-like beta-propeller repeat protein [Planctomycetota bacterium]
MLFSSVATAADWPTYRHDNHRSGKTDEQLDVGRLQAAWTYDLSPPAQPAWAGPAKWDAYASLKPLGSMRDYDWAFQVAAVGGSVFFGSSVDDSVYCLDAATGKEKWSLTTAGPVRIAPTVSDGKVYFGSDDGLAYCLDADTGRLIWKYRPTPPGRKVLYNGRLIPLWPCRTGVLIEAGTAYFAMGMLPWEPAFLCAVDAKTGQPQGPGRYVKKLSGTTLEGAMLASEKQLFGPQGRIPPQLFDRTSGKPQGQLDAKSGGGCFVLLTEDAHVLHGPGNKTGWVTESNAKSREKLASIGGAKRMVVSGKTAYLITDKRLAAINRDSRKTLWKTTCDGPYSMILAGDTLFVGLRDKVRAYESKTGTLLWGAPADGRVHGLAVANGRLLASTHEGRIHCFAAGKLAKLAKEKTFPKSEAKPKPQAQPKPLAIGPCLRFTSADSAVVSWTTAEPSPTILEYQALGKTKRIEQSELKTRHEATIIGLRPNVVYRYTISRRLNGKLAPSKTFECDTFFNYSAAAVPQRPNPYANDKNAAYKEAAEKILAAAGPQGGICLVLGCGEGRLVYELARRGKRRVIGLSTGREQVRRARTALRGAGLYGTRAVVYHVDSLDHVPCVGSFANVIVRGDVPATGKQSAAADEVLRLLQPGGVALMGQPPKQQLVRKPKADGGVWSHQYGRADNSAYGGESLHGARGVDDMRVQWLGRPGPRAQADRNGRKPSPLSTGGRLFMQGLQRIIAIDSYNGTILWSLEVPNFYRYNMPRDCGNWCADSGNVFAVMKDRCWRIDAKTGRTAKTYPVVCENKNDQGANYEWGYVAVEGDQLIGSTVRAGSAFTNFWGRGNAGWYEAKSGEVTYKVCSDQIFSLDKLSGERQWTYKNGPIINSTITIADGRIYFVECRNPKVTARKSRRIGMPELWKDQFMVALDAKTGKPLWQRPLDTVDGLIVFYMAHSDDRLVLVSSKTKYHVYAFQAADGKPVWDVSFDWQKPDHGGSMSRPAIVGGKLYVRPRVIDLATGEFEKITMPDGGCGTYALTAHTVLFRKGNVTIWDNASGKASSWSRLRPGCWLSTIPAGGMILSPEAGGGCSCGSWLETTIGFIPKKDKSK